MTPPSQAQPPRQPPRQQTVLVARSFLRHALSAVCRSRLEGAARVRARARARARASASVAAAAESAATTAAEAEGAAFEEPSSSLLDRWFRPARFGDVPNRLLAAPAAGGGGGTGACCGSARSRGGDSSGDDGGDAHADDGDAAPTEGEDWAAAISSELCGWLERGAPVPGGHRRQPQHQRQGGGILDRLLGLPSRPRPWSGGGAEGNDGDARAAEEGDGDGGGGGQGNGRGGGAATTATTATAAVLVVATWIRGTAGEDYDDEDDEDDDDDDENEEEGRNDDWNRPADGVILERFRFSLRPAPTPTPPPTPATSTSTSAASAHSRYFAQLRTALRTLRGYCDGDDSKAMVDPTEEVDYDAVGRAFTFVVEEEVEEMEEEVEDNEEQEKMEVEGDENACGLFTKASRHNPLDDHHALTMLRCRRRWTSSNDVDGASASTDSSSSYDDNDDDDEDGLGSSTLTTNRGMAADDMYSMNHTDAGIDASDLAGGGTATMMMMMAQQTQSQSQSQADHWTERTERTADGTDDQSATGKDGQSQSQSQFTEAKNGEDYTHSQSLYFGDDDGSSDGDDDDDDDNGGVDRYHLGSIDLGDRLLSVSVERSICAPNSPVVRLLFGDDDDASDNTMEAESATSRSESRRQRDDDMFSVTTTLPSQGAMGYSLYRHMQPIDAHPSHDDNLEGGSDDASNGSMVTPPPPMSTILVRTNSDARQADLNGSIESTQPSQGTGFSTQQSSITEGASQRSRRRKGSKKKKSARARANADVSKIMGVRRRDCIPRTRKSKSPPALTPMPPAGNAARSTGKRPALASALRNGSGKRPALSNAANNRSTRFSPLPKVGNGGGNTPMRRAFGTSSRSPAISSTSTVLLGSAANNTPVPVGGASGRSPAISGTSTATVLMSRYGSVSEAETVLMSRTPTPPRKGMGRQG